MFCQRTLIICCLIACAGCGVASPDRPAFDPRGSAKEALSTLDANSDGFIDEKEVEKAPGLKAAFAPTDADQDGKLTADEIEKRITYYKSAPTTIVQGSTLVTLRRRPLVDATVTFEPEPFLGSAFGSCSGMTDEKGIASIKGHDAEFPGIYLGFYRVRVSREVNGKETIPAKYNSETEIGYEATDDLTTGFASIIQFHLK